MAIECQSCTAPAELWICPQCITELRADLLSLAIGPEVAGKPTAGLLDALHDVVTKQTATGGSGGHRKRGDDMPDPFEPHTAKSQLADPSKPLSAKSEWTKPTRQGQASDLLHAARNTLTTIVRDLLGKRKISPDKAFQVVSPKDFVGPLLPGWRRVPSGWQPTTAEVARWLATHAHALACDEAAGRWKREVDALVAGIKKVIDRPPTPRFCGPCIHYVEHNRHCGRLLYARRDAIEVTCRTCRTTHNIEHLSRYLENRADIMRFTSAEILIIMNTLGSPLPERTWYRWRTDGRVKIRGWKRPDNADGTRGAMGLHQRSEDDQPLYRLAEVRKVYATAIKHSDALVGAGMS